jgi:uncharacterized metal-binding protein
MFYDKPVTWRPRLAFILAGPITWIVWICIVVALVLLTVLCALINPMLDHAWLTPRDWQRNRTQKEKVIFIMLHMRD